MLIAQAIAGMATVIAIGCVLLPIVLVTDIILCIVAAVAASKGERYRYPFALRLIS